MQEKDKGRKLVRKKNKENYIKEGRERRGKNKEP
jgi:hypothetical protein